MQSLGQGTAVTKPQEEFAVSIQYVTDKQGNLMAVQVLVGKGEA